MLVQNGKILYEKEHLERIKNSAKILEFNINHKTFQPIYPFDLSTFQQDCICRISINKDGLLTMQSLPLEPIKTNLVTISNVAVDSRNPLLYHKTDFRPWYDEAMQKIKQSLIFDEFFFNEKGELTEGARSNIVLQIDGELYTPPVESGLLNGILRQKLIKEGANFAAQNSRLKNKITEKILYLKDLQKAEKVFCINSVRSIVEVEIIDTPRPLGEREAFSASGKTASIRKAGEGY